MKNTKEINGKTENDKKKMIKIQDISWREYAQ